MSLVDRLFGGGELRGTLQHPNEYMFEAFGGERTHSGKRVTQKNAMELVPIYSAVQLLAGSVASLPFKVFKAADKSEATASRQWSMFHDKPNEELEADEFFEILMTHLALWGNHCSAKIRGKDGRVSELWPLDPRRCQFGRVNGKKVIFVDDEPYGADVIWHVRGLGTDGLVGFSPVQMARNTIANLMAQEEFVGRFWAEGTMVSGFLKHPQELSEPAAKRLHRMWRARWGGLRGAGRVPVLEEGMEYQPATMPLKDAEFIAQAKFGDLRVAQMFRVPPYMLGAEVGNSLTYSTLEGQGIDFVRWSLGRWLRRIERSAGGDPELFPPVLGLYGKFVADSLQRGSTKERYEGYEIGIRSHVITPNEARAREDMEPLDGGDEFPDIVAAEQQAAAAAELQARKPSGESGR